MMAATCPRNGSPWPSWKSAITSVSSVTKRRSSKAAGNKPASFTTTIWLASSSTSRMSTMNKIWILDHLREAHEELSRTIGELESDPEYGEGELYVAMAHLYHHLNTAWNSRAVREEERPLL